MVRAVGCSTMILPARSRQTTFATVMPMVASKAMPARRRAAMSCGWVPRPTPRPVSASSLRSNTTACQPAWRRSWAASSPPSDPPMTRARRVMRFSGRLRQRPGQTVVAGLVIGIGLRRIAVHQWPAIHRIGLAARLMLDREQHVAAVEVDEVVEPVLVIVAFLRDQPELVEPPVRSGKIRDVDLHVMSVVRPFRRVGLAEIKILFLANLHAHLRTRAVFDDVGGREQHLPIKPRDARCGARPDLETDIGHAKLNPAKTLRIGRMHMDAVAPRTNRLDAIVAFAEVDFGLGQRLTYAREAFEQGAAIGHHQSRHSAQDLRCSHRQMELAHADIDPHIAGAGIEERVARQSKSTDIEVRCDVLIADANIDVTEIDDIAD